MLKFCSLYSGSSGNCSLVQSKKSKILIDAGVSCKKIESALQELNIIPEELDGILVTHEHTDHVQGLGTFIKKHNVPLFINEKTYNNMPKQTEKFSSDFVNFFDLNTNFQINDLEILPFSISHDAANPCGFNIIHNNKKISIATDLGHISQNILKQLENSCFVLIEANYDPEVLKCSPYPYSTKTRIASDMRSPFK